MPASFALLDEILRLKDVMEKPDNCDHLAVWQEISPFLCNVNMGQFNLVYIAIFFALLHARLKCLGLQR